MLLTLLIFFFQSLINTNLMTVESWSDQANSWGFQKFVPFADLKDTSKGLLVNDTLKMEIEFEDFSNTKYFPS